MAEQNTIDAARDRVVEAALEWSKRIDDTGEFDYSSDETLYDVIRAYNALTAQAKEGGDA